MSTPNVVEIEGWLMLDEDGDWVFAKERGDLKARYEEDVCELDGEKATCTIRIALKVPKPKPVELTAVIPEEPAAELKVVGQ